MTENPLLKKLGAKPGKRILILNAPDGYLEQLQPLPEGVELHTLPDGQYDLIQVFVLNRAALDKSGPLALTASRPDSFLWFSFPKGSSKIQTDITRDSGWELLREAGYEGVSLISVDNVWSAFRFRPAALVKSGKK
ncbi:MAG TPA: hypothetical protein VH186_05880 [Chloroflexia bacterium]|nr:hypothetical protein [Chloroflexia bacterium]